MEYNFNFFRWVKNYPAHFTKGFEKSFFENSTYIYFIGASALTLTLSRYDEDISYRINNKPLMGKTLSELADSYGKTFGWGYFLGIGFVTIENTISGKSFSDYFFKIERVLESIALTQLITQTLKVTTMRGRPNGKDKHSFPSGHTSSAFALAASLDGIYGYRVGIPAYIFASMVGLQRISSNSHYLSDVLGGVILGIFVGRGFAAIHEDSLDNKNLKFSSHLNYKSQNSSFEIIFKLNF